MPFFHFSSHQLMVENCAVSDLINIYGSPTYIYSKQAFIQHYQAFAQAFKGCEHFVCFAVKSNPNIAILQTLAQQGAGFDIVSQGELERVLVAGGDANKVVFSGVAKTENEIKRALEVGIYCFNVESFAELKRIQQIAQQLDIKAPIALRVNPDIDAKTHPYISTGLSKNKFGLPMDLAKEAYVFAQQQSHLEIKGMACHIGSQITSLQPFLDTVERLKILINDLKQRGIFLSHVDLGGGLGVSYQGEKVPSVAEYVAQLETAFNTEKLRIIIEPGRAISANAGILVAKVEYLKSQGEHHFAVVNTGMNDMLRPALYQAQMEIVEVNRTLQREVKILDVAGPICESADFLGKNRALALAEGDYIALLNAGAYGASMGSNYNSRVQALELLVDGNEAFIIKERAPINSLWQWEKLLG